MAEQNSLPNFLGLQDSDFQIIERYLDILTAESPALAQDFYDYLLAHPVTAAVFRDFSRARLDALIEKQMEHANALLQSHLDASWRESMRKTGVLHHRLGIDPSWVAGAYILYWRHWQKVSQKQVAASDRQLLQDALFRLLIGDLMTQLDGYAHASRETDTERQALFHILLGVLAAPRGDTTPRPEEMLQQICAALPRKSDNVRIAGYTVSDSAEETLTLECLAGLPLPVLQIEKVSGDPCWEALESGQPIIRATGDPQAPEWIKALRKQVGEIGFFPFGGGDLRGVGLIGVREEGYFYRVGPSYFDAFTRLGELVLLLRRQSLRDPLTALPNRALFLDRLEAARNQSLRRERMLGVAIIDLDGFKQVNDRLGHSAGDQLLQEIVRRLQSMLRSGDTLARLGGDEFGLLLPDLSSLDDFQVVCERLLASIREPIEVHGDVVSVSGSIGFTVYPLDDNDIETLIRHADLALYAAKEAGRDQFYMHTLELDNALLADLGTIALVERALQEDRLVLHYQPIVSSTSTKVCGVEALLRLQHPEKGLLAPAAFFSALDHPRLARPIGRFVLETALRQGEIWQQEGIALRISVNISARHLLNAHFLEDLQEALARHPGLPPESIEVEITESASLYNISEAQVVLSSCHSLGVQIGLDDFGTGNASLIYLQQLPANSVKIDQSFVRNMISDPKDLAIVTAVITASRILGLEVVAEGVETTEQAALLAKFGCSHLQGYLFSKPLPAEEISDWVTHFRLTLQTEDGLEHKINSLDVLPLVMDGRSLRIQKIMGAIRQENPWPSHVLEENAEDYCHLGRWLQGEGARSFGRSPKFAEILTRHERIHQFARVAKSLLDAGNVDEALQQGNLLEQENDLLLTELLAMTRKSLSSIP